jgi:hypothetical protein
MNGIRDQLINITSAMRPAEEHWQVIQAATTLLPGEVFYMLGVQRRNLDLVTADLLCTRIESIEDSTIHWKQPWDEKLLSLLTYPIGARPRALAAAVNDLNITPQRLTVLQILGGARTILLNPDAVADLLLRVMGTFTTDENEVRWSDTDQMIAVNLQEPKVELRYPPLIGPSVPSQEKHDRLQRVFPLPSELGEALRNRQS